MTFNSWPSLRSTSKSCLTHLFRTKNASKCPMCQDHGHSGQKGEQGGQQEAPVLPRQKNVCWNILSFAPCYLSSGVMTPFPQSSSAWVRPARLSAFSLILVTQFVSLHNNVCGNMKLFMHIIVIKDFTH